MRTFIEHTTGLLDISAITEITSSAADGFIHVKTATTPDGETGFCVADSEGLRERDKVVATAIDLALAICRAEGIAKTTGNGTLLSFEEGLNLDKEVQKFKWHITDLGRIANAPKTD
jgi:hypothetical protein